MRHSAFSSSVTLSRGFSITVSSHTARYRFVVRAIASAFDLLAQAGAVLTSSAPIGEEEKRHLTRIVIDTSIAVGRDAREQAALIQRLHAAQMTTTRALHSAGVVDGRRLLGKPPRHLRRFFNCAFFLSSHPHSSFCVCAPHLPRRPASQL